MFYSCRALKTIYVSESWNTNKVTSSSGMFTNCTSLIGGNGTTYNSSYTDKTYARIDAADAPGYLTGKTYKLKTGLAFNALIPETTTAIVFTDETKPSSASSIAVGVDDTVVGWLDGTTFKVSTQKQGRKVIFNEDSSYMFCGDSSYGNKTTTTQSITSIDFTNVDTSKVTNMVRMFAYAAYNATSWSIEGLSNWDTSNVTNMSNMFQNAGYKITLFNLDLSNWNTSNVTSMYCMFNRTGYNSTTFNIDLSNWNVSNGKYFNIHRDFILTDKQWKAMHSVLDTD